MATATPTAPQTDEYLPAKELCFRLGIPVARLLGWVARGAVPQRGSVIVGGPGTGTARRLQGLYSLRAATSLSAVYHANKAARAAR